jgi:ornithine--oxo-acid transaminase
MTANVEFIPKLRTQDYVELEELYGAHNYHPLDVVITHAKGVWVYDVEGRKYLDCLAAYSAVNQGHCHPKIMETAIQQARRLTLTSRAFRNDQLPFLCKELHELTGMDMVLPMNSGAEAVETALKAARKWGYTVKGIPAREVEIVTCANNFHGRTITILSFSTEPQYRDGFGPFTPGFVVIPYDDPNSLRRAITPRTCAFLVEPIQGEAGIILPRDGYLRTCYEICRDNNVLFIADEIQSGLGRTGKLFAFEYEGIRPELVIIGKALSGGYYPVSAVLGSRQVLEVFKPGDHGSTFGGNPMGCAIARSALRALVEEGMVQRSAELGGYFLDRLKTIRSQHIREVRGKGLWIGMELNSPARPFCEALKEEGILCKETHDRVLRIAPPLVITRAEIDWALERFARVLH